MKKFVTAALVTAMLASMSLSAFADISFGSGADADVSWPDGLAFSGNLTVLSGEKVSHYETGEKIVLNPGDVLYMPLFHEAEKAESTEEAPAPKESVPYTGKIDKDWKIHFSAHTKGHVEKASFHTASSEDSYLEKGAVYVKIDMADEYDSVKTETISCGVYIRENRTSNKTNQAQVRADFENPYGGLIDFEWNNSVYGPTVLEVDPDENGKARFDFADEAFFTVDMYGGEKVLLNLSRSFDKKIALEYDERADLEFYNFKGTHDEFVRNGILSIPAEKGDVVYEVVDGELEEIDYDYNSKEKTVEIKTHSLGYYVLSDRELDVETTDKEDTKPSKPSKPSTDKENPNTGAADVTSAAAALAVVSVAAAGALAMKKK